MNKRILFLLVASIVLGAGVFGYVKHQKSVEVDTSIAGIIATNAVEAHVGHICFYVYDIKAKKKFVDCYSCVQVCGDENTQQCTCPGCGSSDGG